MIDVNELLEEAIRETENLNVNFQKKFHSNRIFRLEMLY